MKKIVLVFTLLLNLFAKDENTIVIVQMFGLQKYIILMELGMCTIVFRWKMSLHIILIIIFRHLSSSG